MRNFFINILSLGVEENAPILVRHSRKVFNFDCLLAILCPVVFTLFYLSSEYFYIYSFISLLSISFAATAFYFHYSGKYTKAVFTIQFFYLGLIFWSTFFIQSPLFPLFLIPISISFLIYFVDKQKYTFVYSIGFILMGLCFSIIYHNFPSTKIIFENHKIKSARLIFFGILFLYKIISLVLIYRKTIELNQLHKDYLIISEKRYRAQFENNLLGMIVFDNHTEILDINLAFCQMMGYTKDELIKEKILNKCFQDNPFLVKKMHQLRVKQLKQFTYNKTFQRKDGFPLYTIIYVTGSYDEKGNFVNTNFSILDVTEKKAQEKMIQKTFDELNKKNADLKKYIASNNQLENFAYVASHDLKAPLRTISSYSQLLVRRANGKLDETELEFFDFIINASKNMSHLIENLLVYSKVNSQAKIFENINVNTLLQIVTHQLKADIDEKNVQINFENIPIDMIADNSRLKQLFQNLISNAIKFMEKDKVPTIHIKCEEKKDCFLFSIKDNGIGIKPEFHEKIFTLFQKLHSSSQYEGTGIGLALCKEIVDQHGGDIWVKSTPGNGTTFFFSFNKNLKPNPVEHALKLEKAIAN